MDIYTFNNNIDCYSDVRSVPLLRGKVEKPEITIFIPTYNRPKTLSTTLRSVLQQNTKINYEVIIVDNASTSFKENLSVVKELADEKVYYYINEKNIGLCGNWNRGIKLARGKYITMIHDDDVLSPYFLEIVRKAIEDNSNPGIIGVDYICFTSLKMPMFTEPHEINYRTVTKLSFFFGRYVNIAGLTVNKSLLVKIGGYSESFYPNVDTYMIYQGLLLDNVINIEYPLAGYRQENNLSLSDFTMKNIIQKTEIMRRSIAKKELFAKMWMYFFDKEFLFNYIEGANSYWKLNIDYRDIFMECGIKNSKINIFKYKIMLLLKKIIV